MKMFRADEIDNGNMIAQLDEELRRAVEDVLDVNKKSTAARTVNLKITVAPAKSRREAEVTYKCEAKLASHDDRDSTTIWLDRDRNGEPIASVRRIDQPMLPGADDATADESERLS